MFSKNTLVFALLAFSCFALAFEPLAFLQGFNTKLNLQDNNNINSCIYRFLMMNPQAKANQLRGPFPEIDIECVEAFESYFESLMSLVSEGSDLTSQATVISAVATTHSIFERLGQDKNFAAGQEAAVLFAHFAGVLNLTANDSFEFEEGFAPVNTTALLLGLNEQLNVVDVENLGECVKDETQLKPLVKAVVIAMQENKLSQAISSITQIVQLIPELRSSCVATLQGFEAFVKPIAVAYKTSPQAFIKLVKANIVSNHFDIAAQLIGAVENLEKGDDYDVGVTLGKVIQTLLKGI